MVEVPTVKCHPEPVEGAYCTYPELVSGLQSFGPKGFPVQSGSF